MHRLQSLLHNLLEIQNTFIGSLSRMARRGLTITEMENHTTTLLESSRAFREAALPYSPWYVQMCFAIKKRIKMCFNCCPTWWSSSCASFWHDYLCSRPKREPPVCQAEGALTHLDHEI